MHLILFAALLASGVLQTSAELELNDEQNADVNQIFEKIEKKIEEDLATLKSELLSYVDNIKKTDCPTPVPSIPRSCASIYGNGERKDGIYTIDPDGYGSFPVVCDMQTSGGGWTVFQRRQDGSEDFYRGWSDYKKGFGDLNDEFWLGLDYIHRLTKSGENDLRVDLTDFGIHNNKAYADYATFTVASEADSYRLNVAKFSGNAGDSLSYHNGQKFTTKDKDNDLKPGNCAEDAKGGWWYKTCATANLNGLYLKTKRADDTGVYWYAWHKYRSLKKVEMKVRPTEGLGDIVT